MHTGRPAPRAILGGVMGAAVIRNTVNPQPPVPRPAGTFLDHVAQPVAAPEAP
jgi:hypothetical protein